MLRQDNLPGEKDEANSSSRTEIDVLNKKILYQDELLRKKDEANSNLSTLNDVLKTKYCIEMLEFRKCIQRI